MSIERAERAVIEIERGCANRRTAAQTTNYCRRCYSENEFVSITEAARFIKTGAETILKLAEAEVLHSRFAPSGETTICLGSLLIFEANRFH